MTMNNTVDVEKLKFARAIAIFVRVGWRVNTHAALGPKDRARRCGFTRIVHLAKGDEVIGVHL